MNTIIIQKNISQALEYAKDDPNRENDYIFITDESAKGARIKSEEDDFNFLKSIIPKIQKQTLMNLELSKNEGILFFGWDAHNEKKNAPKF